MKKKKLGSLLFELVLLPVVLLLALGFSKTNLGTQLENLTLDWRFQARMAADPPANPEVLIVGIDGDALSKIGRWPWNRDIHAELVKQLVPRQPKAIAFDILFTEPSDDKAIDLRFGDALALTPNSITAAAAEMVEKGEKFASDMAGNTKAISNFKGDPLQIVGNDTGLLPVKIIGESSNTGFVNSDPGMDGIRRDLPIIVRCGTHIFPSLVLQTLLCREGLDTDAVEVVLGQEVRVKGPKKTWGIPIDGHGMMRINYRNGDLFQAYPYARLLGDLIRLNGGEWPKENPPLAERLCFIGQTATGLTDLGASPFGKQIPLVLVHANAVNNILNGDFIRDANLGYMIAGWILMALVTVIALRHAPIWLGILVAFAVVVVYVWSAFQFFASSSLHLPVAWPVIGFGLVEGSAVVHRLVHELRAKSRIKGMFGTYLSPQVVEQMIASGEEPKLGGVQAEITAFFSDIAGFSAFSELLPPDRLVTLMNDYLTEMTDILQDNGGTLDKFIGDAIVGMFGAPLAFEGHAYSACRATVLMQKRQAELREKWRQEGGWPDIVYKMKTRMGLNSGPATIGNMGSRRRFSYTMMGDTVNLAARSESGAKSYGVYTMITGETKAMAEKFQDDIAFRFMERIVVKGRSKPAEVYEVVGFKSDLSEQTKECLALFQQGVERYLAQDWNAAKALFEQSSKLEIHQDANPSQVLLKRTEDMAQNPPAPDWDGVYVMKTK